MKSKRGIPCMFADDPIMVFLDDEELSFSRHTYWRSRVLEKYPVIAAIDWVAPEIKTNTSRQSSYDM